MPFQPDPSPPYDYIDTVTPDHPHPLVAEWQAHIDAGRIGTRAPLAPALLANLRATEALIGCRRHGGVW